MAALTTTLNVDSNGTKFGVLVDSSTGLPVFWRSRLTSSGYAAAEVALYDANGNPLLKAAASTYGSTDAGVPQLAVRKDAPSALGAADGNYQMAISGPDGALWVRPTQGTKTFTAPAPTTTAGSIVAASTRKQASIFNNGSVTVYLGKDNTVTAANGYPLPAGASLDDDKTTDAWWGITASGAGDLRVLVIA